MSELKPRRTWPQRALLSVNVLLIVACLVTAWSLNYFYSKVRAIGRVELGHSLTPGSGGSSSGSSAPQNILIVGTDSAEGLDPDDPVLQGRPGGIRSDVIMILRLDPSSDKARLLSLPRDLWVPIAGLKGSDRINSTIQGGPQRLIDTIKNDFGIPVNHYIEMNFLAFRKIVAAVDGVPIYFTTPVRDNKSGLDITDPGCVTLDPVQALAFARSRAYEYFENGRWHTDPTGDLGRISRQQEFIRRVIRRAIDKGARNPAVLNDLINAGTSALHLDPTITPSDLIDIGKHFKDFNPENLETYSVPTSGANKGGASVLLLRTQEAEPVFDLFRGGGADAPEDILLTVQNGTTTSDLGASAAQALRDVGFSIPQGNVTDAERLDFSQTTIRYLAGSEAQAQRVASYLVTPPVFEKAIYLVDASVNVVVGADWQGVRSTPDTTVPLPASTTTLPRGARTTTTSTTVAPDSSAPSTTTTSIGVVPETPQDVSC